MIATRSYRPLLSLLEKYPKAKITLNICGSLTEQLSDLGFHDILENLRILSARGQIEFVGSAKYHPILPKIPPSEIKRQIVLNEEVNKRLIGKEWSPKGFFPPEMAYSALVKQTLIEAKYEWVLLDESAHPLALVGEQRIAEEEEPVHERLQISTQTFIDPSQKIRFLFRDREESVRVAFGKVHSLSEFLGETPAVRFEEPPEKYSILMMDGETFGYHQPQMLKFLEEFFSGSARLDKTDDGVNYGYELVNASSLFESGYEQTVVEPRDSTWGRTLEEEKLGRVFPRWDNPRNVIHKLQWDLLYFAVDLISNDVEVSTKARDLLDKGLQSDQFWWASHNPCWHPPMIQKGADLLMEAINLSRATEQDKKQAKELYDKIIASGKDLFGDEVVAC